MDSIHLFFLSINYPCEMNDYDYMKKNEKKSRFHFHFVCVHQSKTRIELSLQKNSEISSDIHTILIKDDSNSRKKNVDNMKRVRWLCVERRKVFYDCLL